MDLSVQNSLCNDFENKSPLCMLTNDKDIFGSFPLHSQRLKCGLQIGGYGRSFTEKKKHVS